ncbi:K+/H+ antiporter subunit F [Gilvimarinus agarilyticus]|uniref:K+/H+ antiporter subunit F n=1 Tax=unclassified Gilvimarinus TaxID=2642066 RepID=UPI001C0A4A59|nr:MULTISPECIES: K+/H+ antiporter subunit F [unclassified Gilvimarinus]MBU2886940.1 K+/H+ antiporter subunit F [Gilvimarinus agarilyticus]MDO6571600.1 K+/H+ antiporter subunit F [Gilvimarinus sp. 2_MG-2023]MDO6747877.1 K+/H+ antiporter subunit F [Gilvimarinus sp. 1_MG-2023]
MLQNVIQLTMFIVALALVLNVWRLCIGPSLPDRILALDTMYINTIALLVLFGMHEQKTLYFEGALLIAVMGFVGTVALSKYLLRGDIIE